MNTCQFQTLVHASVPRIQCEEHGVVQVRVPWAEPHGRTIRMERFVINVHPACQAATGACQLLNISWDQAWHLMDPGDGDDDLSVGPQLSTEKDSVLMYGGKGKDTFGFNNRWRIAGSVEPFNKNKTGNVLDWNQGGTGSPAKPPNKVTKDGPNTRIVFAIPYEWVHYCFWYSTLDGGLKFQSDQSFQNPQECRSNGVGRP